MTNIEDVSFTEILTTPLGESWTHHCCLGGNPHFLQKLTENALVGLVTFWLGFKIVSYKDVCVTPFLFTHINLPQTIKHQQHIKLGRQQPWSRQEEVHHYSSDMLQ